MAVPNAIAHALQHAAVQWLAVRDSASSELPFLLFKMQSTQSSAHTLELPCGDRPLLPGRSRCDSSLSQLQLLRGGSPAISIGR